MTNVQATGLSEKDLITNILNNFFIVDYGYINKVNADKTVNVTHAAKPVLLDGTELGETTTDNVEILTISGAGFSIQWDYKAGDKVLLLGLKDYIPNVDKVSKAEVPKVFLHYDRTTIKAIPLCIFSDKAKVQIAVKDGDLDVKTQKKIKLNGESKQFVTWAELNQALTTFTTALVSHTHNITSPGNPSGPAVGVPTIDISAAKTTTVVTGG